MTTKPIMYQEWRNLLFLHWEFPPEKLQPLIPKHLKIDTFNGKAYVGIIPFFINQIRLPNIPFPRITNLLEVNMRTYVCDQNDQKGIWFFSLDINSFLSAFFARTFFKLPYYYSSLRVHEKENKIDYSGKRNNSLSMKFKYQKFSKESALIAKKGTLEYFLIERYQLFTEKKGKLFSLKVKHSPYPLYPVDVEVCEHNFFENTSLSSTQMPPIHSIFSSGVDVDIFGLEPPHG